MVTLGAVLLLFLAYELVGTGWAADRSQDAATAQLTGTWALPAPPVPAPPATGDPVTRLHVPRFGPGWSRVVLEGTDQDVLARGPGHYAGTALPGQPGNVALAGHRVGSGAPFDPADRLLSCDPIVLEGRDSWWVYRVLPTADGTDRPGRCAGVGPLDDVYRDTVGREIVTPEQVDVVAPVPHHPGATPTASLLTLTTCHPRFSARQRLVVHAVLVREQDKSAGPPAELGGI